MTACGKLCKLLLTVFNTLMIIVGFVKLSMGLYMRFEHKSQHKIELYALKETRVSIQGVHVSIGVLVLTVTGPWILVSAVLGFYGAFKENRRVLIVCSVVLGLLAAVDFVAAIPASIHQKQILWNLTGFGLFICPGALLVCSLVCSVILAQQIKTARLEAAVRFVNSG